MNNDENYAVGSSSASTPDGAVRDSSWGVVNQRLRIHVPTGDSSLDLGLSNDGHLGVRAHTSFSMDRHDGVTRTDTSVSLGVNEQGFVGVLGMADHGNVFLCATGAADLGKSYRTVSRVNTIVETAINVVRSGLMLWGTLYHGSKTGVLPAAVGIGQTAWLAFNAATSPASGSAASGWTNTDYLKTGHLQLFGARSVRLDSIEGVSSSSALFNSHSAGFAASLNSIVFASVNSGVMADLKAGYAASVTSQASAVVGGVDVGLSARVGNTRVEGQTVRVGNKKQGGLKNVILSGIQERTEDLWMRAASYAEVGVPSGREMPESPADDAMDGHLVGMLTHPNGLQVMRGSVRLNTNKASLKLAADASTLVGRSLVRVGPDAVEIGRLMMPVQMTTNLALDGARLAYNTAWGLSEGIVKQISAVLAKVAAGTFTGTAASVGLYAVGVGAAAGVGTMAGAVAEGDDAKALETGAIVGAAVGAAGILTAVTLTAMKAAGKVQRAGQRAAQKAYVAAQRLALLNEVPLSVIDPTGPQIQVKDGTIVLAVGPLSTVTITASGIKISAASVKINDVEMAPAIPGPPPMPVPPAVEAPPVDVSTPADNPALMALLAEAGLL